MIAASRGAAVCVVPRNDLVLLDLGLMRIPFKGFGRYDYIPEEGLPVSAANLAAPIRSSAARAALGLKNAATLSSNTRKGMVFYD